MKNKLTIIYFKKLRLKKKINFIKFNSFSKKEK